MVNEMQHDKALEKFEDHYAKKLILEHLGDDAEHLAEQFRVNNFFKRKYQSIVLDNKSLFEDAHVLDVGSNMGHWATLYHLNGARSVTCVEPRLNLVEGLNRFAVAEDLPIKAIQGIHSDCPALGEKFQVVMLSNITSYMPDVFDFFSRLRAITDHVIIGHHITMNTLHDDACTMDTGYNLSHRNAVDLRDRSYLDRPDGVQYDWNRIGDPHAEGRTCFWYYGIGFMRKLLDYLGYDVVRVNKQDNDELYDDESQGTSMVGDQTFYDMVLRVRK